MIDLERSKPSRWLCIRFQPRSRYVFYASILVWITILSGLFIIRMSSAVKTPSFRSEPTSTTVVVPSHSGHETGHGLSADTGVPKSHFAFNSVAMLGKIPKIVWMTSKNPLSMKNVSGFDVRWFNDEEVTKSMAILSKYVEPHGVYKAISAFNMVKPWAYKADIWRYAVLFKYGGIYLDHEVMLRYPLDEIVKNLTTKDNSFQVCSDKGAIGGVENKLWQGFLITERHNPIMLEALKIAVDNVLGKSGEMSIGMSHPLLYPHSHFYTYTILITRTMHYSHHTTPYHHTHTYSLSHIIILILASTKSQALFTPSRSDRTRSYAASSPKISERL